MDVLGFLMMSYMVLFDVFVWQVKLMESYGVYCVYVIDSGGVMIMDDVVVCFQVYDWVLKFEMQCGIYVYYNLLLGVVNSIVVVQEGVICVDVSLVGMGVGVGNVLFEVFIVVVDIYGWDYGIDLFVLMDVVEDFVCFLQDCLVCVDCEMLIFGYVGVYLSFLCYVEKVVQDYGFDICVILIELGCCKMVGGQEDMIVDVVFDLVCVKQEVVV